MTTMKPAPGTELEGAVNSQPKVAADGSSAARTWQLYRGGRRGFPVSAAA
jgi:hypothetical protein